MARSSGWPSSMTSSTAASRTSCRLRRRLTGFPEAIEEVFPHAWVQTCIVHRIRGSMRYVAFKDRRAVARDLKPVYRAINADAAQAALEAFDAAWGERYPMIADSWRTRWPYITPYLALPADLRRAVYTTNSIGRLGRPSGVLQGGPDHRASLFSA
jgi:putative transposase